MARLALLMVISTSSVAACGSASIRSAGYTESIDGGAPRVAELRVVSRLPRPADGRGSGDLIRVGDQLQVDVFKADELDYKTHVDSAGNATLPLLGPVPAAGRSLAAFEADVTARYGERYLQRPQLTVALEQSLTLDGEFRRAGVYPISSGMTLLKAVATAGNFTETGDPGNVFVYRSIGGQDFVARYDVAEIRAGREPDETVYGGDIVVAFASGLRVFGNNLRDALGIARSATGLL